ncbi:MAG: DUF350 domain-containing protein [Deltaproteobacteria bacterium]|nr:DUF350 domain-containing protein [Deltaproteobacteria bacterium]
MFSFLSFRPIAELFQPVAATYLLVILAIMVLGKRLHNHFSSYDVDHELTTTDNKAVALSVTGYLFALGLILWGVITPNGDAAVTGFWSLIGDLLETLFWGLIGIGLLQVSHYLNDRYLLPNFSNHKEIIEDRNIGTGVVEGCTFIASGIIIKTVLSGSGSGFFTDLFGTIFYFAIGQAAFLVFGRLYQRISRFDLHHEIEQDNAAAGVAFGLSMIAVGILLADYIAAYDSLPGLIFWLPLSFFFLVTGRYIADKLLLPGALLDEEISRDRNWGAALIEGAVAIIIALVVGNLFFS